MSNSRLKKENQLGMSLGKSGYILLKKIIFDLVISSGQDKCYRCGKPIDDIDEFSIEHIKDWIGSDNPEDLFFDYDNISFSHIKCNMEFAQKKRTQSKEIKIRKRPKTGFKNVYKRNQDKFYHVILDENGKKKYYGGFESSEDAAKFVDEKLVSMYGENAETNKRLGWLY